MQQTCLSPLTSSLVQAGTISHNVNSLLLRQREKAHNTFLTLADVITLDFPLVVLDSSIPRTPHQRISFKTCFPLFVLQSHFIHILWTPPMHKPSHQRTQEMEPSVRFGLCFLEKEPQYQGVRWRWFWLQLFHSVAVWPWQVHSPPPSLVVCKVGYKFYLLYNVETK